MEQPRLPNLRTPLRQKQSTQDPGNWHASGSTGAADPTRETGSGALTRIAKPNRIVFRTQDPIAGNHRLRAREDANARHSATMAHGAGSGLERGRARRLWGS